MDVKSVSLNGLIKEEMYVDQPLVSRMIGIPIMSTSSPRCSMGLRKHQELGNNALEIFKSQMLSWSGKLIELYSLTLVMVICLYVKYMSMALYLVLLIKSLVISLAE
jgi:Na+/glutamate symporter